MTAVWRRSNCRCKLGRLLQAAVVADDPAGSVLRGRRMCASRSRRWHGRSPESERRSRSRGGSPPLPGHPRCGSPGARRPARSLLRAASTTAITRRPDSQQAGKVSTPPADVGHRQVHATGAGRQRGQPSSRSHAGTQGFHQSLPETRPTHARRQALPGVSAVGAPGVPGRAAGAAGPRCSGGPSWRPRQPGRRRTWWPPSPPGAQRRTGRRRGGCGRPAAHLIWRAWLSSGSWACRLLGGEDVVMSAGGAGNLRRRAVGLRCAGWLPHDRGASERSAGLAIERHPAVGSAGLLIGGSRVALALGMAPHRPAVGVGQASRTARLQHHPASSRATATTLMVERLARASSRHQRWWSRRLPRSARSRTAAGWPA
jgi:hypothetical protein